MHEDMAGLIRATATKALRDLEWSGHDRTMLEHVERHADEVAGIASDYLRIAYDSRIDVEKWREAFLGQMALLVDAITPEHMAVIQWRDGLAADEAIANVCCMILLKGLPFAEAITGEMMFSSSGTDAVLAGLKLSEWREEYRRIAANRLDGMTSVQRDALMRLVDKDQEEDAERIIEDAEDILRRRLVARQEGLSDRQMATLQEMAERRGIKGNFALTIEINADPEYEATFTGTWWTLSNPHYSDKMAVLHNDFSDMAGKSIAEAEELLDRMAMATGRAIESFGHNIGKSVPVRHLASPLVTALMWREAKGGRDTHLIPDDHPVERPMTFYLDMMEVTTTADNYARIIVDVTIPETIRHALVGMPMARLADHPHLADPRITILSLEEITDKFGKPAKLIRLFMPIVRLGETGDDEEDPRATWSAIVHEADGDFLNGVEAANRRVLQRRAA